MQSFRINFKYPFMAIARFSARLFCQESNRVAFIEQPEFALGFFRCAGVKKNASLDEVPVKIGYQ